MAGGPGCSGQLALLNENGPCTVTRTANGLEGAEEAAGVVGAVEGAVRLGGGQLGLDVAGRARGVR